MKQGFSFTSSSSGDPFPCSRTGDTEDFISKSTNGYVEALQLLEVTVTVLEKHTTHTTITSNCQTYCNLTDSNLFFKMIFWWSGKLYMTLNLYVIKDKLGLPFVYHVLFFCFFCWVSLVTIGVIGS